MASGIHNLGVMCGDRYYSGQDQGAMMLSRLESYH